MSIVGPRKYQKEIDCGTTVVYRHCPFAPPTEARIKRIAKEHYVVKSTAELRRYSPRSETKGDNLHSVRQSFNRLKSVITANVRGNDCVRFLPLPYADLPQAYASSRGSHDLHTGWYPCASMAAII